jgi:hypothetical protein
MPFASFVESLRCLDNKRILNQVVEAWQIWCCLKNISHQKWRNRPMIEMWCGYEEALQLYIILALKETETRITKKGRNYSMPTMRERLIEYKFYLLPDVVEYPPWMGVDRFHDSHKAALYRKNPIYYIDFKDESIISKRYYWPV